jgi:gliding motility-associated lipoprotein GldH
MKIRRRTIKIFLFSIVGLFAACHPSNEVYYRFESIPHAAWDKNTEYKFDVEITDTLALYDVFVEVRNNNRYNYRNLWLFVSFKTPEGNMRKDTLNCELANEYGEWYGKGRGLHTIVFPYDQSIRYPYSGTYSYIVKQGMRSDRLEGISDIGIRVVKK